MDECVFLYTLYRKGRPTMKNRYYTPEFTNEKLLASDVIMSSGETSSQNGNNLNSLAAGVSSEAAMPFGDL